MKLVRILPFKINSIKKIPFNVMCHLFVIFLIKFNVWSANACLKVKSKSHQSYITGSIASGSNNINDNDDENQIDNDDDFNDNYNNENDKNKLWW